MLRQLKEALRVARQMRRNCNPLVSVGALGCAKVSLIAPPSRSAFGRPRSVRGSLARDRALCATSGAALSQGQVHISRQAQRFDKVRRRSRGRRGALTRSGADFVAGAALSQGQVQISWQENHCCKVMRGCHFRKVRCRLRGRCSTFARSSDR